ncbi:hypothetical protein BC332_14594 [Capsicum chinense]|nr:hypothetical protein BC332_14594 [Capsicum chinense]
MGEEDTFENLKYLCFEEVTLAKWDLGEESFPVLEKLALWECHKLEEIPPSFGNISSLKFFELYKSPQLEHSALKIKQYVDDMMGGDTLKVEISRAPTEQNDLLDSNTYSIALIKEEIGLVKEDLEFIRSFFTNIDQEFCKDLWARILDVAYEAKDVIDSIIVRGIKEKTNWLIRKFISGPANLDVISITGMPGSGKTTLAYKVYTDESVCSHFDLRAGCTVDQEYDEKNLLVKLFNQVTGSDLKFSDEIDVADKLRKQLRYLIVLDDVWDTTTWDDLTRPFPEAEKGSRIIWTTQQKDVAFHG